MTTNPIQHFENAFADYQGAAAARAFWMGRVGMYAMFKALGIGPGDRVGICAFTCLGVVESVTRLQATPVFLDVDRHMNISPHALESLSQPLSILVLQHTFGVPCQLDACLAWAVKHGVPVVEDCCHTLDATWRKRKVGTFALGGIFAFEWGKPFSAGQGGLVTFQDESLAREVDKVIAAEAIQPSRRAALSLSVQRPLYRWLVTPRTRRILRSGYRWAAKRGVLSGSAPTASQLVGQSGGFLRLMSRSQARAACRELRRWPDNRDRRRDAAAAIRERLNSEQIPFLDPQPETSPVYLRVPLWVTGKPAILAAAEKEHLDIAGWYASPAHPLQGQPLVDLGYDPKTCPTAEEAFNGVVTLPTRPALTQRQEDAIFRILHARP